MAVAVGVVWVVAQSGGGDLSTGAPPATLDETPDSSPEQLAVDTTQPAPTSTRPRATTTTRPPLVVGDLGGPMLPTPSGFELVGLTAQGDLLDINLDTGQMMTTDIPGGSSDAMATILAGQSWTFIQRWDVNQSIIVPRGEPPSDVAPPPEMASGVFRGPDPDTVWLPEYDPFSGVIEGLNLIGLDGQPLGRSIDMHGWWPMQSDLAGGVMVQAGGGVYVVSETGARRVADGDLAGVGANHFLVRSCDEALVCGLFVVDRQTGERRQVPVIAVDGTAQFYGWTGTDSASVSPDGTAAVLFGLDDDTSAASLMGTDTGVYRTLSRHGRRKCLGRVERRLALRRVRRSQAVPGLRPLDRRHDRLRRRRPARRQLRVPPVTSTATRIGGRDPCCQWLTRRSSAADAPERSERRSATRRLR